MKIEQLDENLFSIHNIQDLTFTFLLCYDVILVLS